MNLPLNTLLALITRMSTPATLLMFLGVFLGFLILIHFIQNAQASYDGIAPEERNKVGIGVNSAFALFALAITLAVASIFFLIKETEDAVDRDALNRVVFAQEKVLEDTGSYTESIQVLERIDPKLMPANFTVSIIKDKEGQSFEASIIGTNKKGYSVRGNSERLFTYCKGVRECSNGVWLVSLPADFEKSEDGENTQDGEDIQEGQVNPAVKLISKNTTNGGEAKQVDYSVQPTPNNASNNADGGTDVEQESPFSTQSPAQLKE